MDVDCEGECALCATFATDDPAWRFWYPSEQPPLPFILVFYYTDLL